MHREKYFIKDSVRKWLEYKIESTRGTVITVKARGFFKWIGRKEHYGGKSREFWQLVEEIAPELGLRVLERVYRRVGNPSKIVFIKP